TYTTIADGFYQFTGLVPGNYSVQFVLPAGYTFTTQDVGGNAFDTIDSDANPADGKTGSYTLVSGQYNDTVDAGAYRTASIGDFVWEDTNANGKQDGGEPGISGAVAHLFKDGVD